MVASTAPSRPRRWSGLLASLSAVLVLGTLAAAQVPKAGGPGAAGATKGAPAPKAAAPAPAAPGADAKADAGDAEAAAEGTVDTAKAQHAELEERYKDPRAEALLANSFPQLFANARSSGTADDRRVAAMAAKNQAVDPRFLNDYVKYQLSQLTSRGNIEAMLKADAGSDGAKAIEAAGSKLVTPLITANQSDNQAFRTEFTKALVAAAPDVLKNHLYARTLFMVALSRSQDPQAAPIFLSLLDDAQQPISIKLLASIGLTSLQTTTPTARWGGDASPADAIKAGRAVAGFLEKEPDAFWPAQMRALEALAYSRQASNDLQQPKGELAVTAMKILANPKANLAVRARAAWALSMIRPNPQLNNYNYHVIAQHAGLVAAEVGARILAEPVDPLDSAAVGVYQDRVRRLVDSLIEIDLAFEGDAGRKSGFLLNAGAQRRTIDPIAAAVKRVTAAAIQVSSALPAQLEDRRAALAAALDGLRSAVAQPGDTALFQGGPQFPVEAPASRAPAATPKGATARAAAPAATRAATSKTAAARPATTKTAMPGMAMPKAATTKAATPPR